MTSTDRDFYMINIYDLCCQQSTFSPGLGWDAFKEISPSWKKICCVSNSVNPHTISCCCFRTRVLFCQSKRSFLLLAVIYSRCSWITISLWMKLVHWEVLCRWLVKELWEHGREETELYYIYWLGGKLDLLLPQVQFSILMANPN